MWSGLFVPNKTTNLDIIFYKEQIFRNMYVKFVQELHSRQHWGVNIGLLRKRQYRLCLRIWHVDDRASRYILIIKANEMHYFWN